MDLLILRHGYAGEPLADPEADKRRSLTKDGQKEVRDVATFLRTQGVTLSALITSPLPRAHETALIVADVLGTPITEDAGLAEDTAGRRAIALIGEHADASTIMLVGHGEYLTKVISQLTGARTELKKGGIARITINHPGAREPQGTLRWLVTPKMIRSLS